MRRVARAFTAHKWGAAVAGFLAVSVVVAILVSTATTVATGTLVPTTVTTAATTTTVPPTTTTAATSTTSTIAKSAAAAPPDPAAPGIVLATATFDLPDPFILHKGGTYYMYVSTPFGATQLNVPVLQGGPGHWSSPTDVLPTLPPWAVRQFTWTPAVYPFGSNLVLYFSSVPKAWPSMHCIGVAVSSSPLGPFTPSPTPLVCHPEHGGDIDAQVFNDPAGPNGPAQPNYLIWKSDNNSTPGDGPPTFWAQPLSNDGLSVTGQPTRIYWPRQAWQLNLLEAPQMVKDPYGRLWLFYSGGGIFNAPTYALGFARCDGPIGPCYDTSTAPLIGSNRQGTGPGEETVFQASDGSTWMLYNPWHAGQWFNWVRPAEAARIVWLGFGPTLGLPPGSFPAP